MAEHKKYESDLTRKEKREIEIEKLKAMNTSGKIEYIWAYYKAWIFGIIGVILLIIGGINWYQNLQKESVLYVMALDAYGDADAVEKGFREYIGDDNKDHTVTVDYSVYSVRDNSQLAYTSTVKMNTVISAGAVDVVLCPESIYRELKEQDILMDLTELLGESTAEKYKDKINGDYMLINDSPVIQKTKLVDYDPAYLVVLNNGHNQENAAKFIEYIEDVLP